MKKGRLIRIVFIFSFNLLFCFQAASSQTDSLKSVLKNLKETDTNHVNTLIRLCWDSYQRSDISESKLYASKALKLSEKIQFRRGISGALYMMGITYKATGNFEEALKYHQKALKLRLNSNNYRAIADSYNSIGDNYNNLGNYKKAIENFILAQRNYQRIKDKTGEAWAYCNIGVVLANQNDLDGAIENYTRAVSLSGEAKNYGALTWYLTNLGNIYITKKDYKNARKTLEEAVRLEQNNEVSKVNLGFTYNSLGKLSYSENNRTEALRYYLKALDLRKEVDDKNGVAWSLMDIGSLHLENKNYQDAVKIFSEALIIAREIKQPERIRDSYDLLSLGYFHLGDFKRAYEYHVMFTGVKDSLLNGESNKIIHEMKEKHKAEVKDREIKLLSREKSLAELENKNNKIEIENQQTQRNFLIAGCISVVLLAFYIFSRFRSSQKQKQLAETHKQILEEKNHEITQSIEYAKKIQTALIPSADELKKIFPDSFILYKPKDIVSGDFYWFSNKGEYFYYATADCTGHGVPGGFMSMLGMSLLNEIIDELNVSDCGQVLNIMREKIIHSLRQAGESESKDGMDMVLVKIHKSSGAIQYAAANNPVIIIKAMTNETIELPYDKMPVGVYVDNVSSFSSHQFQMEKGDKIFTFTDGYADQFGGEKRKKFKYTSMKKLFVSSENMPMEEIREMLEKRNEEWRGDLEQVDDVCIIGIRV